MTIFYVDPSIDADTGAGTVGDPYGDLQHALDTVTRGSAGDKFNIKAGTAEVFTSALDFSTYGVPTQLKPVTFQGYTSADDDGGHGAIDCTGLGATWAALGSNSGFNVINLDFTWGSTPLLMDLDNSNVIKGCIFDARDVSERCIAVDTYTQIIDNQFINFTSNSTSGSDRVIATTGSNIIARNYFHYGGTSGALTGIIYPWTGDRIEDNIFVSTGTSYKAMYMARLVLVTGNTFYSTSGSADAVDFFSSNSQYSMLQDNVFEGYDVAVDADSSLAVLITANNSFYNNTTDEQIDCPQSRYYPDNSLSGTPFDKVGTATDPDDRLTFFAPTSEIDTITRYTDPNRIVGAVQPVATGGGGNSLNPLGGLIR